MRQALYTVAQLPWFVGLARILDVGGALNEPMPYESFKSGRAADAAAMAGDWAAIYGDINTATEKVATQVISRSGTRESA